MIWNHLLRQMTGEARLEEVAEHAATRCRHAAWERVRRQINTMGPAEARGYVRARSSIVVYREIDRLLRQDGSLRAASRARLIELTSSSLQRAVADQVVFTQTVAAPRATPMLLRRAA